MSTSAPPLSLMLGGCPILFLQFYWLLLYRSICRSLSSLPLSSSPLSPSSSPLLALLLLPSLFLLLISPVFLVSPLPLSLFSPWPSLPSLLLPCSPPGFHPLPFPVPQIVLATSFCSLKQVHSKLCGPGCSFPPLPSFCVD